MIYLSKIVVFNTYGYSMIKSSMAKSSINRGLSIAIIDYWRVRFSISGWWFQVSTPLKNISQLGLLFPISGKTCSKTPTRYCHGTCSTRGYLWIVYGWCMDLFVDYVWVMYGLCMDYLWICYWICMDYLWISIENLWMLMDVTVKFIHASPLYAHWCRIMLNPNSLPIQLHVYVWPMWVYFSCKQDKV